MKTLFTLLLTCLFIVSTAAAKYSGGTGEPNDPYQIATAADLTALGETPEDYDKHFLLTADIDLDPNLPGRKVFDKAVIAPDTNDVAYWFQGTAFTGVFDSNAHTILHLTITGRSYLGLFGQLGSGARVSNLGLEAVEITGTGSYVGGLVGNNGGAITTSYSTGSVSGTDSVGGLVGENWGLITTSYSSGSVRGAGNVGGLVGDNSRIIVACYSTSVVRGNEDVGGLVGQNWGDGTITTSYSTGLVAGTTRHGGLVGDNWTYPHYIIACFWDTQTSGQTTSDGGTGKTTTEMQDPNTFTVAGWDFVGPTDGPHDIWAQPAGGGYPVLYWQLAPEFGLPMFSGGTGEPNAPYLISSAQELNSIGHNPRLMNCHFRLVKSLDLTGREFYPIGALHFSYTGVFDGAGHVISHLRIAGESYLGLFGRVGSPRGPAGEVRNLELADVNIAGSGSCVGGLVGYNYGTIVDCHSSGSVSGDWAVGGLVGTNGTWGVFSTVTNCHSTTAVSGRDSIGGLVGWNEGSISMSHSTGTISGKWLVGGLVGCNGGNVTASYSTISVSGDCAGGLVGSNYYGRITGSHSTGSASGTSSAGGLVGFNGGDVSDSYSTSDVTGEDNVGGLVGYNGDFLSDEQIGVVTNCYSAGAVVGTGPSIGGLVGYNDYGFASSSFWDVQASSQAKSAGGTGKTTTEMQTASTFLEAGWDFVGETGNGTEDIWWILEGKDYPRLWWELEEPGENGNN